MFGKTAARSIQWLGSVKPRDLSGGWPDRITNAVADYEERIPEVKKATIRGQPHASTTNPTHEEVVSVQLQKEDTGRLLSIHVLADGTVVEKRRGRGRRPTSMGDRKDDKGRDKKDEGKDDKNKDKSKDNEGKGKGKGKDVSRSIDRHVERPSNSQHLVAM